MVTGIATVTIAMITVAAAGTSKLYGSVGISTDASTVGDWVKRL